MVLTPCFLFTRVGFVVSVETFVGWWPLLLVTFILVLLGAPLGHVLGRLLGLSRPLRRLTAVVVGFKNVLILPLGLAETLCATVLVLRPGDTPADAFERASAYILFSSAFTNVLLWTVANKMMESDANESSAAIAFTPRRKEKGAEEGRRRTTTTTARGQSTDTIEFVPLQDPDDVVEDETEELDIERRSKEEEEVEVEEDGDAHDAPATRARRLLNRVRTWWSSTKERIDTWLKRYPRTRAVLIECKKYI